MINGIKTSSKEYIICTDSDNQIKVESLIENLDNLPMNDEFLIGYRNPRRDPMNRLIYSKFFKILHDLLFDSGLKDPSCPFVVGLNSTYNKLDFKKLLFMKEGFWWGFIGVSLKSKIYFIQKPIEHFSRKEGEAGYQFKDLIGIIFRNVIGLIKIKLS